MGVSNYCAPHQTGTLHLYYGPSALTPAMSPHVLELYRSPCSPSPFPHTRPDRSWLAARPGSAPLNDLGRPALTAPGSTDVPEVSPPSLPSLSPSTRTTMPGRTSPFSGESTLRHTDRDRSATWCRVTYIVNTLYLYDLAIVVVLLCGLHC